MKKGKILLYVLMWWLMGMVFANFQERNAITGIVNEIEDVIESSIEIFGAEYEYTFIGDADTTMLCCKGEFYEFLDNVVRPYEYGEYILSFFLVLVFYLLVDKKVWKS